MAAGTIEMSTASTPATKIFARAGGLMARGASSCGAAVGAWVGFMLVKEGAKEEALRPCVCRHKGA